MNFGTKKKWCKVKQLSCLIKLAYLGYCIRIISVLILWRHTNLNKTMIYKTCGQVYLSPFQSRLDASNGDTPGDFINSRVVLFQLDFCHDIWASGNSEGNLVKAITLQVYASLLGSTVWMKEYESWVELWKLKLFSSYFGISWLFFLKKLFFMCGFLARHKFVLQCIHA